MQRTGSSLVLGFSKGVRRYFLVGILLTALYIFFYFLSPQIIGLTVDSVIGDEPFSLPDFLMEIIEDIGGRAFLRDNLIVCAAAVVGCAVLTGLFQFLCRMSLATFSLSYIRNIRNALFAHTQRLPFSWHVQNQTGDIIQRCTSDIDVIRNFAQIQMFNLIRTILAIAVALSLMFSMHTTLSLIAMIFIPLVALYSGLFFRVISRRFLQADEAEGDLMVSVQEALSGVRVVRAFGRQRFELSRFDRFNVRFEQLWVRLGNTLGLYWGIGELVTGLQVLTVMAAGVVFASRGELSLGQFIVFVSYNQMLAWPVRALGRVLGDLSKTRVSMQRILEILEAPEERDPPEALTPPLDGDIVFEHVTFSYLPEQPVLRDVSFTIKQGTTLGILGSTGSGKSTITYLLNRLYDLPPEQGRITIGGVDIQHIARDHLRRHVGLVLQEPFLFSKTVRENIAIATPDATLEHVRAHTKVAALDHAVLDFKDGYDTIVGERGVTLSGGQKQRMAIARTLMQGAPILVFDDSLSAVDLHTDAQIRAALKQTSAQHTVVLISHRINTLMAADQILVLEDGAVVARGTHAELCAIPGPYQRIYTLQTQAADLSDDTPRGEEGRA